MTEFATTVAIIIHRRPRLVRGLLDRLRLARPKKIWVIADGAPAGSGTESQALCQEARQEVEVGVTWPCQVQKLYAETNLGIRQRIETGLDEVFRHEKEAIILEEDCLPGPDFFPFCQEMLARYQDQPQIAGISGNCFLPEKSVLESSYFYSRYLHIWGWATWARVWNEYTGSAYASGEGGYPDVFPAHRAEEKKYWNRIFQRVAGGEIDTWDYPLLGFFWSRDYLAVNPAQNLVQNVGIGLGGTHTRDQTINPGWDRQKKLSHPYLAPTRIRAQEELDRLIFRNHYLRMAGRRSLWEKLVFHAGRVAWRFSGRKGQSVK